MWLLKLQFLSQSHAEVFVDQWWNWSTLSFSFSFLLPSVGRENVCCDPKGLHFCASVLCSSWSSVSCATCVNGGCAFPRGAHRGLASPAGVLRTWKWCSYGFDNIPYPWFGWLLTVLVLASPSLCGVWCQGQLLSGTCIVSEIIGNIVPGETTLPLGVDL